MIYKKITLIIITLTLFSKTLLIATGPSLQFVNGTNTGISSPNEDTLFFGVDSEERLNIDSTDMFVSATLVAAAPLLLTNLFCRQSVQILLGATPSSDVTVNANTSVLFIDWTGNQTITVTITLPPNPIDGQLLTIMSNMNRTNKYVNLTYIAGIGGATIDTNTSITRLNPTVNFLARTDGASVTYIYRAANNTWYRFRRG